MISSLIPLIRKKIALAFIMGTVKDGSRPINSTRYVVQPFRYQVTTVLLYMGCERII